MTRNSTLTAAAVTQNMTSATSAFLDRLYAVWALVKGKSRYQSKGIAPTTTQRDVFEDLYYPHETVRRS